jgi:hypothetical protein
LTFVRFAFPSVNPLPRANEVCQRQPVGGYLDTLSTSNNPAQTVDLNQAITAEISKSGLAVTERELEIRIQNIVKSMMESNTGSNQEGQQPMQVVKETIPSLADYNEDERKARAKVLINLARTHHDK